MVLSSSPLPHRRRVLDHGVRQHAKTIDLHLANIARPHVELASNDNTAGRAHPSKRWVDLQNLAEIVRQFRRHLRQSDNAIGANYNTNTALGVVKV
jgi:hypothetical protein